MSRKGDYLENAVAESFFNILKVELIQGKLTIPIRKPKCLFLNVSKGFKFGNVEIPISAKSVR